MIPPGMEKLLESPQAMAAIERLFQLLETKGINVKSGKSPSMLKLARVAADPEVRQVMGEGELREGVLRAGLVALCEGLGDGKCG